MGQIFDKYEKDYNETIKDSIEKAIKETGKKPKLMVEPTVWITIKYLDDNQITPFDPKFRDVFRDVFLRDPEMGYVVAEGLLNISKDVDIPLPFDKTFFE